MKLLAKTDWSHSYKGAICGSIILIVQLALLGGFYELLGEHVDMNIGFELMFKGIDALTNLAAILACVVGFHHLFYYQ